MEVNITYEVLYELLRKEKGKEELQKLDEGFFSHVASYLKEKIEFLEQQKDKQDIFVSEEKDKAVKQIENIKKILKELYERREKKIVEMATDASRIPSITIDNSIMLNEERLFYESIVNLLNSFRKGILHNLQQAKEPFIEETNFKIETQEKAEITNEKEDAEKPKNDIKSVRFTYDVPKFIGTDLNEYGPFQEGDTAELPSKIADVLINKGRAE